MKNERRAMREWGIALVFTPGKGTYSKLLKLEVDKMVYSDGEGFEVMAETDLGDLTDIKEQRVFIPPTSNVLFNIRKVTNYEKVVDNKVVMKQLNISLALENGIAAGEDTEKYKGAVIFTRLTYWVDRDVYTKDYFKNNQHLVPVKKLLLALGYDISQVKINDELLLNMSGKLVMGTIKQRTSNWTSKSGEEINEVVNEVVNFKGVPAEMRG